MPFDAKDLLLFGLAAFTIFYLLRLAIGLRAERKLAGDAPLAPTPAVLGASFVANFFDTFGIGSFATTTAIFRNFKLVKDELIPGTLNVGYVLPTVTQAVIFTKVVPVEARTLILMIGAAIAGAWLGAGVVSSWPRRTIQVGMGLTLLAAATLMLLTQLKLVPGGGDLLALGGTKLIVGVVVNMFLGALMTLGIGLYGPCMILVSLLGMSPLTAFPIMMGSCAFLMPVASARFIRARRYDLRASIGMLLGGIPAVLVAVYIVKSMPIDVVRWLVIVVVVYTAAGLLRTAMRERAAVPQAG